MAASIKAVYYCSSQASDQLICAELCSTLINRGHSVTVVAEDGVTHLNHLRDDVKFQRVQLKGKKQHGLNLQPKQGTALVDSEAAWLRAQKADVVICGAVPFGCSAAAAAGICAVCIANSTGGEATVRQTTAYLEWLAIACLCWLLAQNCVRQLPCFYTKNSMAARRGTSELNCQHANVQKSHKRFA